ncbi:COG3650 family protein [Stutzerimonas tarimensis]|uniref:COG3650 family protein n=1 Tax=Stutzerimonas tarimensis TaxID=1507735 RepID=A0ABV7T9N7_9GAMM
MKSPLLLAGLLPLLAGCQALVGRDLPTPEHPGERWQGEVIRQDSRFWFSPCGDGRRFEVAGLDSLLQEAAERRFPLFLDMRARLGTSDATGADGRLTFTRLYRLENEGPGCADPNFRQMILRAGGHEPGWQIEISSQGLLLQRLGEAPRALPYLEEQLPEGRLSFSSEADGEQLELWIAPQRCEDNASGALTHLTATFQQGGQSYRGCAYLGGARSD